MEYNRKQQRKKAGFAGIHYGLAILVMGMLVVAGALGLARFGYGMILPAMQQNLGLTHDQTGIIASANMLGYLVSALAAGMLAARFGPRVVVAAGLLWTGITLLLTGFVQGPNTAALVRFFTGVGSAGGNVAMMGLVSAWFAPARRGMAAGFMVGGSGIAIAFTGWLIPYINSISPVDGWRYSWFALGIVVMLLGAASWQVLRNTPAEKNLGLIGEIPGAALKKEQADAGSGIKDLIKIPSVIPLAAQYFCYGFSYIITATFLVSYLIDEVGCTQELAGSIWSTVGFLSIGSSLIWGMLSDKLGRRAILVTLFCFQALAYSLLLFKFSQGWLLWLPAVLFGLTAWGVPSLTASCSGDISDAKRAPAVIGFVTFVFGFGQVLGPLVSGYIKEYTLSFHGAFLLATVMALMGALFSWRIVIQRD